MVNISVSYYSAKGNRANNEDTVSVIESHHGVLAIVADGLGGHADGEVASKQAVSSVNEQLRLITPDEDLLTDAIQQASQDIYSIQDPAHPMHTTVAALWIGDDSAIAANVGDSRIYQFRNGKIIYQSLDHSVAQMAVLVGEMDQTQIRKSKDRNRLIRVLGDSAVPKVDLEVLDVQEHDRFLICSDGFWEPVTESEMLNAISCTDSAKSWLDLMREIVEKANNPAQDNHTAIALVVGEKLSLFE